MALERIPTCMRTHVRAAPHNGVRFVMDGIRHRVAKLEPPHWERVPSASSMVWRRAVHTERLRTRKRAGTEPATKRAEGATIKGE